MKIRSAIACLALLLPLSAAAATTDVGVSVSVGEPGFYGRIDIGNMPAPELIYAQPIIVHRVGSPPPPVYLRVPPGHEKHWDKHCARYGACGRPVYFVQDSWYENVYVPDYRQQHGNGHNGGPGNKVNGRGHGNGHGHD